MTLDGIIAVVVNWRTTELTVQAVQSVCRDGIDPASVVVVDNGSGDGSAELLRRELAGSTVLALPENLGFARASNLGARTLPAHRALLLVNSDAFVHLAGSIARLAATLEDPAVGIAVPRLRNPDLTLQPNVVPASTPLPELVRASGLSRFLPNRYQPALSTHWNHDRSREIQAAIGAVLLVRTATWERLGGFDERGFMYAEDLDLFWRARRAGWRARFVAEAEFVHLGSASATQAWSHPERAERVARAEATMLQEHLGPLRARLTLGLMTVGVGARALVHRLRGNHAVAATQRAWMRGYLAAGPWKGIRGR